MSERSEEFKTVLFYLAGVIIFVVLTAWFTASGTYKENIIELPTATGQAGLVTPTPTHRPMTPTPTTDPATTAACKLTPSSMRYGYIRGAPFRTTLASRELLRQGQPLVISGTVYASDCRTPLPDVLVEIWQPDQNGVYDNSDNFILRGQMRTDAYGRYRFTTIKPGRYVAGSEPLPAHIHYRVSYQDQATLFTQLFFAGDPFINQFPFVMPPLVISLTQRPGAGDFILEGKFDIILAVTPPAQKFNR